MTQFKNVNVISNLGSKIFRTVNIVRSQPPANPNVYPPRTQVTAAQAAANPGTFETVQDGSALYVPGMPTIYIPSSDSAQALAFLARTSGLDATHTAAYKALINGMVSDGIWTIFDMLKIYATQNSATAVLNLISTSYTDTINGAPTFTTDRGFTGVDSSATVFLDTGLSPTTAVNPNYKQNSAHLSAWSNTNAQATSTGGGIVGFQAANFTAAIVPKYSDGNMYFRINDGVTASGGIANANSTGHYLANRSGASAQQGYKNAVDQGVVAVTSGTIMNGDIFVLASNHSPAGFGGGYQITMASAGGALTPAQVTLFYNRLRTYMTTVGVP